MWHQSENKVNENWTTDLNGHAVTPNTETLFFCQLCSLTINPAEMRKVYFFYLLHFSVSASKSSILFQDGRWEQEFGLPGLTPVCSCCLQHLFLFAFLDLQTSNSSVQDQGQKCSVSGSNRNKWLQVTIWLLRWTQSVKEAWLSLKKSKQSRSSSPQKDSKLFAQDSSTCIITPSSAGEQIRQQGPKRPTAEQLCNKKVWNIFKQ